MQQFKKGLQLYTIAKKKAHFLGIISGTMKMERLICTIQEKEGNVACFRKKEHCPESRCCWQASCTAQIIEA